MAEELSKPEVRLSELHRPGHETHPEIVLEEQRSRLVDKEDPYKHLTEV